MTPADTSFASGIILTDLLEERARQNAKFPDDKYLPDIEWLPILAEEAGEVAKAIMERDPGLREELIQTAAVAIAWVEAIDSRKTST